nr:uncharacterized protein LOC117226375 [Megalopta genalis]
MWRERWLGRLTYQATQVFTGRGCFGVYPCRIGREATTVCHHCCTEDSALHTLEECPAFTALRRVLVQNLGVHDLSLSSVVGAMLEADRKWKAVVSFCEQVMSQKEAAERDRKRADKAIPGGTTGTLEEHNRGSLSPGRPSGC